MKKITISDYEEALRAKYEETREGEHEDFLNEPTPAGLKKLCLLLLNNINAVDMEIYKKFFFLKEDKDIYEQINNFETTRFRALQNFLIGGSETSSEERLNLLAVLVNLQPRPYRKFKIQATIKDKKDVEGDIQYKNTFINSFYDTGDEKHVEVNEKILNDEFKEEETAQQKEKEQQEVEKAVNTEVIPQKYFITGAEKKHAHANLMKLLLILVLLFVVISFTFKDLFLDIGCMVWKEDHYEEADCDNDEIHSFTSGLEIKPMDKEVFKYMKKIKVSDTTTFFNPNGNARIWYGKSANKEYEYFTYPGLHPDTGKLLKEMSHYMVDKYFRKKNL